MLITMIGFAVGAIVAERLHKKLKWTDFIWVLGLYFWGVYIGTRLGG